MNYEKIKVEFFIKRLAQVPDMNICTIDHSKGYDSVGNN